MKNIAFHIFNSKILVCSFSFFIFYKDPQGPVFLCYEATVETRMQNASISTQFKFSRPFTAVRWLRCALEVISVLVETVSCSYHEIISRN